MKAGIVIGRIEGFISSVGIAVDGVPFLYRGPAGTPNLAFAPKSERLRAVAAVRVLCAAFKAAGIDVEGQDRLDGLDD